MVSKLLKDAIIHAGRAARGTGGRSGIYEKEDLLLSVWSLFTDLISTPSMHGKTDYINHFLLSDDIDISRFLLSRLIPVLSTGSSTTKQ